MQPLKNILEGKPLRSPLHPALVHLPIALFPISVLLDLGSWMCPMNDLYLVRGAYLTLLAGVVSGLFAAIFGIVDYSDIRADHPAKKTATLHMVLNFAALGLFAVSAGLRYESLYSPRTALTPLLVSVAALAILAYSGYLGGRLVYDEGIAVGRHRRESRVPESTIVVKSHDGNGMVEVAEAGALKAGETLRVEVNGTVIAMARAAGKVCAFQEFCTHRYGPLSEGAIHGSEVVCPWHNSRFDMRTGKVTAGPAKEDLRTFRAETRDGKIWVEVPARK